ncbi:hypothetical protein [Polaromonas eurypsychrophila]|uniref:DUF4124 domain-containing protein n=1 Tax=Polaromonas eurypsychrophila TaxID=1614635 RepID=A0A916SA28_9BURK|nr:hypothetical protein [Polaromonas eurypsychrophila]GGA89224.1 hypothetical protein GCM10011496_07520 [Polaromonas eurypsychrophila]
MGLMDREHLQDNDRQRPFSPPPERSGTLGKVLISLVILFFIYLAADWKLNQQAPDKANKDPANTLQVPPATSPSLARVPTPSATPNATGNARTVTKCVVNGKTSYGDSDCGAGASATQLVTKDNFNLMSAVRVPVSAQTEPPTLQPSSVAQAPSSVDYEAMKTECKALDERIKYLDALARQPQSGQTQDWIRDERKKARDRQVRIPCR